MSWTLVTAIMFVIALGASLALSEWVVRRRFRRPDDDQSTAG